MRAALPLAFVLLASVAHPAAPLPAPLRVPEAPPVPFPTADDLAVLARAAEKRARRRAARLAA